MLQLTCRIRFGQELCSTSNTSIKIFDACIINAKIKQSDVNTNVKIKATSFHPLYEMRLSDLCAPILLHIHDFFTA